MGGAKDVALSGAGRGVRRLGTWQLLPFALIALGAIPLSYLPPDVPSRDAILLATARRRRAVPDL